ncbi:MAG: sulfatase, partial [Ignavibacteriaceae bacterium]
MKNKKGYSRRKFISAIGASAVTLPLINSFAQTKVYSEIEKKFEIKKILQIKPRSVIFILSDDHRFDFMSFIGKPKFLQTPNMDRMANEGAHIENAFVTTSLCSPSRASILTGQFSHKHGVVDNDSPIPEHNIFFPEYLQKLGYETGFMGKWHMGQDTDEPRKGFDKWVSFRGQGVYYNPTLNVDGKEVKREGYITDILTEYAVDWINQKRDKPYFLYLSHKAVHAMFEPAERHLGKYENEKIEYPPSMDNTEQNYSDKPHWVKAQRYGWHGVDYMYHGEMNFDNFYRRYCETLLALDEGVGKVIDSADKSTLIFYMGDNGFCLGEHGLIDKRQMYEESMRVPLLAYCPELIKPGTKIKNLVQNIDIAPTVLELAGMETPEQMDGKSILPLLKGEETKWRDAVFYEYYWERPFPHTPTVFGIRTDKYKFMTFHGIWDIDEFYDIEDDPN